MVVNIRNKKPANDDGNIIYIYQEIAHIISYLYPTLNSSPRQLVIEKYDAHETIYHVLKQYLVLEQQIPIVIGININDGFMKIMHENETFIYDDGDYEVIKKLNHESWK
jgi:hypothetical protein